MAKTRVLFITRTFPPTTGGMELFAYQLSTALASKVDLHLVKWSGAGRFKTVRRLKTVLIALPYLFLRAFGVLILRPIDVIHAQDGVLSPIAYMLAKVFRKPFVVVIHGLDATYKNPVFKAVVPWALRHASQVICISEATAVEVRKHGVDPKVIAVVPLAVDDTLHGRATRADLTRLLDIPSDTPLLLTVGRLVERKGVAWFIDNVLPDIVAKYPNVLYLVVGEGHHRPAIEAAIQRTHLEANVRLLGQVSAEVRDAAYNGCDVFVMPNLPVAGDMEGFGLVLLEASLCELPVVASNLEGIADAIADGKNGVLLQPGDVAGYNREVVRLLANPKAAHAFGERSRRYTLDHYEWGKAAERYRVFYEQLSKR